MELSNLPGAGTLEKSGYSFVGWTENPTASTAEFENGNVTIYQHCYNSLSKSELQNFRKLHIRKSGVQGSTTYKYAAPGSEHTGQKKDIIH
ncbi:MAG: hypothetical protein V8R59_14130 [Enterocloster sp.]